jgi:hypothetical protein
MKTNTSPLDLLPGALRARLESELPSYVLAALRDKPKYHDSPAELFRMSGRLLRAGFDESERRLVLETWFTGYYRRMTEREIERAVTRVSENYRPTGPKWPEPDARRIAKLTASATGSSEILKALSEPHPEAMATGAIIDRLFAPTDLLCLASSLSSAVTDTRDAFRDREHEHQFIVPNPMSAATGLTSDGRVSRRCLANTGPLTYQVVEFDQGTLDEQAKIHLHLAGMAKLCLVVFSGNKSLHGWYDVRSMGPEDVTRFRRYVAALGADKATFTPCQLVRTPNARRDNGAIQTVLFLAPHGN